MTGLTFAKRWLILGLVPLVALLVGGSGIVWAASVVNGSFETGDLTGWSTDIPAEGFIEVISAADTNTPKDGAKFAHLKTNGPGSFTTLSQSVTLSTGDEISGYAYFFDGEEGPGGCGFNDSAEVTVGGTTVFSANSCDTGTVPWTLWSHTFGAAGTFLIEAKITNGGDSFVDSFMGLDDVALSSSPDTPPTLNLPSDITGVEATGTAGKIVNYTVTATDNEDVTLTPSCSPPSGSVFGITTTIVNCSVTDSGGNTVSGSFTVTVVLVVSVDIKPGSTTNPLNLNGNGNVPVAILGNSGLNVSAINVASVSINGAAPTHDGHIEDVNDDGFADLVVHFREGELGIPLDTPANSILTLELTGELNDAAATPFSGQDNVRITPNNGKSKGKGGKGPK